MRMWNNYSSFWMVLISITGLLLWQACANPITPTGGPKDVTPPQIDPDNSDANRQTNFTGRYFELTFDEWITLTDAFNQIVVSPPLEFTPEVTLQKRTVRFAFDEKEVLRPDATYIINFGNAVKDLNEGNPAKDLRFVFSTGDFIDSLSVQGSVADALSGDPVSDVIVLLYDNLADSVVRTERPFYFGRTDKQGRFRIENMKSDTFKVFALVDENFNYLYDTPTEQIGYIDSAIVVNDSVSPVMFMQMFEETPPLRLLKKETKRYGRLTLVFNQPPDSTIELSFDSVLQKHHIAYEADSIHLWYQLTDSVNWSVYLQKDSLLNDTIELKPLSRTSFEKEAALKLAAAKLTDLHPSRPIALAFNHPLTSVDTSAILLLEDTLKTRIYPDIAIDDDPNRLVFNHSWQPDRPYELLLLPNALTDWYGLRNDSLSQSFKVLSADQFGTITLQITNVKKEMPYVVRLLKKTELVEERYFTADSIYTHQYTQLVPGVYSVRIIEDVNGNKRWDPGNYDLKTQPEKLYFRQLEELRADWEVESTMNLEN